VKLGIFFVNDSELFSYFVGMGQPHCFSLIVKY
jgi:hypothetical protein